MQLYVHHMVSKRFAHQGPKAQRLCKLRRDRIDTMGYASTHPRPSNYSVGCKRLEHVPSNSSNNRYYSVYQQSVVDRIRHMPGAEDPEPTPFIVQLQHHS